VDARGSPEPGPEGLSRDADLLEAHRRRDYAAVLDGMMQRYRQKVVNLSFSIVREPALAQDMAQLAFMKFWRALPRFDGRAALSTWLYTIARNTCLGELRSRGRWVSFDPAESDDAADVAAEHGSVDPAEATYDVARLLDGLAEPYRRVVVLFYLEERSCDSIAQLLGIPEGTIKSMLFRARKRMAANAGAIEAAPSTQQGVANAGKR